ncbi:MAG: 1-acyl-sn-glycerol-3-phosphate acyltransferase [Verrucomicrobiae bacterium]|nr:1-acyl-sn-glycerol-3-phosphate acyltransferase [Verrucomicrobiae bacterium]
MGLSYWIGKNSFKLLFHTYFRGSVHHADYVPTSGGFILASNHASFLDPPMVGQAVKQEICYLARKSLFRYPVAGQILRSWKAIPVERDEVDVAGMRAILTALKNGNGVMIFPEGTRTDDGGLQPARPGVGFLVAKANVPVVPARIWGSLAAMGRGKSWPRPHKLIVTFGKPLTFDTSHVKREEKQTAYQKISEDIMAAIAKLEPREMLASPDQALL